MRGGVDFLLKIPQGGWVSRRGEGRGGRRVSAANWGIGGGAKYFFSGPKCPPSFPKGTTAKHGVHGNVRSGPRKVPRFIFFSLAPIQ